MSERIKTGNRGDIYANGSIYYKFSGIPEYFGYE